MNPRVLFAVALGAYLLDTYVDWAVAAVALTALAQVTWKGLTRGRQTAV